MNSAAAISRSPEDDEWYDSDQLKLPFALWTREAVQKLIEKRWHIRLSVWRVDRCYSVLRCFVPRRQLFGTSIPVSREREPGTVFRKLL
jgi:hypothetical protein